MLVTTPENTPIMLVNGMPKVVREKIRPEKDKLKGDPFARFSEQELIYIILAITLVGILGGIAVLACLLPLNRLKAEAFKTRPTPPGAKEFYWLAVFLLFVPGLIGLVGLELLYLNYVNEFLSFWHKPLTGFIYQPGLWLAVGVAPLYFVLLYYFVRLYWLDQKAVKEYLRQEVEVFLLEEHRLAELEEQQEQKRQALRERLYKPGTLVVGRYYLRYWDSEKATWVLILSEREEVLDLCYLDQLHYRRHTSLVAPTRSGKTNNFIKPLVRVCRRAGFAAIFFDPKGNEHDPADFDVNFSLQRSERDTSIRLCLIDPTLEPHQAASRLAESLIKENPVQPFFSDSARQGLVAFLMGHFTVFGSFPELSEVLKYASEKESRSGLVIRLREILGDGNRSMEERQRAEDSLTLLSIAEQRAANTRSDALGSMYNALLPLATGQYREYVTTNPKYGVTIREMLEKKLLVRIAFTADEGETGQMLGRLVIQQFTDMVLSPSVDKSTLKLLVIDEAHNYICESLKRGVAQAAGNNAGYVLAFQSLKQIPDEATRSIILGNCRNRFILSGAEHSDAELYSREFGEMELEYISSGNSRAESTGQVQQSSETFSSGHSSGSKPASSSNRSSNTGSSTSTGQSSSTSRNVTHQRRPVWLPREISQIPRFHAVVQLDDGTGEPGEARLVKLTPFVPGKVFGVTTGPATANGTEKKKVCGEEKMVQFRFIRLEAPEQTAQALPAPAKTSSTDSEPDKDNENKEVEQPENEQAAITPVESNDGITTTGKRAEVGEPVEENLEEPLL